jgi:serine/threonine-protein kinase
MRESCARASAAQLQAFLERARMHDEVMPVAGRTYSALIEALAGRYAIERELGRGGMATVYLARDVRHERDVAVKVLDNDVAASVGRERFLREIQLAARLSHPHILPLYDSGEADGALYYVMPTVEGRSLRDMLDAGPLPIADAVRIACDVASALDFAHRRGVVHRDIKPENVLLHEGVPMVTDFGIGKALGGVLSDNLTQAGMSLGTPAYMSPEQAVGEEVDGRSDIYSLGCVLYEMLVGEPPFTGPNAQSVIAKRFVQAPADVTGLREGIARPVARAVQKALARTPIDRFETAAEMQAALRESEGASAARTVTAPAQSVAVLPFENLSADKENEYFGDGIAEEIINVLAQVKGLRVAARTSAFSFKGKRDDLRVIGEKLSVATVLEGSVRKAGARLRITAQLIDVADGYHLWSERYDRELVDVFAVQDEIAAAIASKLQVTFDKGTTKHEPATPQQVEAFELFIQARAMLARRIGLDQAISLFERVIELDPSHTRARVSVAEALRLLANFHRTPRQAAIARAKSEIDAALAIDSELADAHATLAVITIAFDGDVNAAIGRWERALAINPSLSEARVMYALYGLGFGRGDFERATAEAFRAQQDDPRSTIVAALAAQALLFGGRYDEALEAARRSVELDPHGLTGLATLSMVLVSVGDAEAAMPYATRAIDLSSRSPLMMGIIAWAEAERGNARRADAYFRELVARAELDPPEYSSLAMAALATGRLDEAFDYAKRSVETRELLGGTMFFGRAYTALRADPRFEELRALRDRRTRTS